MVHIESFFCLQETKAVTATEASPHKDDTSFSSNASAQDAEEKKNSTGEHAQGELEGEEEREDNDAENGKDGVKGEQEDKYEGTSAEDEKHDMQGGGEEEEEYKYSDGEQEWEAEEAEHSGEDEEQKAVTIDLSCMKTLYQFRNRPTLPYLLTEYGMEDKDVPMKKVGLCGVSE